MRRLDHKGFSLIEIMISIMIFMVGMLGVAALQIANIKANSFAGNIGEASFLATSKLEELLGKPLADPALLDTDADGTTQDINDDNVDDNGGDFGLGDNDSLTADGNDSGLGRNGLYSVFWNIARDEPAANCLTIGVISRWSIKNTVRTVSIRGVRRYQ